MFNVCSEISVLCVLYSDVQLVNQLMLRRGTGTMRLLGRNDVLLWTHGGRQVKLHIFALILQYCYDNNFYEAIRVECYCFPNHTFLVQFGGISGEFGQAVNVGSYFGEMLFSQNTHGETKQT